MIKPEIFLDFRIAAYIGGVVLLQLACGYYFRRRKNNIIAARAAQNLPPDVLVNNSVKLAEARQESLLYATVLLSSVLLLPLLFISFEYGEVTAQAGSTGDNTGLALTFLLLLSWVFFSATDVSKAYLGGLAFKTMTAFQVPFQVGDRASFEGIEGRVTSIGTFFTTLQTQNDDKISIPTSSLWHSPITSVNGSSRSSLCVMNFYLSSHISKSDRIKAENHIWDSIQSSAYFDPTQPIHIFLQQNPDCIQLIAKAYVASTYREPMFTSDVTTSFLDYAIEERILPVMDTQRSSI